MIRVFYSTIENISSLDFENFIELVSFSRKEKINSFKKRNDSLRSLLGACLVRYAFCNHYRIQNQTLSFAIGQFGKPVCETIPDAHFSLSHAGKYVLVVLDSHEIGVDIEKINKLDLSIVSNFFSESEVDWLYSKNYNERIRSFFKLWTIKESYIKYLGLGLYKSLNSFEVVINGQIVSIRDSTEQTSNIDITEINIDKNYFANMCHKKGISKEIKFVSHNEIINKLRNNY